MIFNDTQIPSNRAFAPNMDIKTWKPGVALMFERWGNSGTNQTFNDAINDNSGFEDASNSDYEAQYKEWIGKTAKEIAEDDYESAWYADGKTIPSDYESYIITWDNNTFDYTDILIAVDHNTKEILLAVMYAD